MKKKYSNDLFICLDWILKKTKTSLSKENLPSVFLLNRWLSMTNSTVVQIINETFNKWTFKTDLYKENELVSKFYKTVLPKTVSKISYLKKNNQKTDTEDEEFVENISQNMELSQRELYLYNETLEVLKSLCKYQHD